MVSFQPDRYVSLLTDFGFKRVFGTEPNKRLLIDFLNTLLPEHHRIHNVTFKNTENLGSTPIDRKAIFDIYCEAENGDRFIVEIQKVKQNFFKDHISPDEQRSYQSSLKAFRDWYAVEMIVREDQTIALVTRLLTRRLRQDLPEDIRSRLLRLPLPVLEDLSEAVLEFTSLADLEGWLVEHR